MDRVYILAVDDDPDTLYTLEQIFRFRGWIPLMAGSWKEAENMLSYQHPSLILLDYHMPDVDGLEAVRIIRKKLPKTPVLVLTSEDTASVMERFLEAGANDYALKPIRPLDLISRISAHLQFQEQSKFYADHDKNIAPATLEIIENYLRAQTDYISVDQIVEGTGLKKKTVYRYIQYMTEKGQIETTQVYGAKGRPRVCHRWKR